ncbi:hypothetical protein [Methylorubrum extorquens]|jgi:hypothetical protein
MPARLISAPAFSGVRALPARSKAFCRSATAAFSSAVFAFSASARSWSACRERSALVTSRPLASADLRALHEHDTLHAR